MAMFDQYSFLLVISGVLLAGAISPGPSFIVVLHNSIAYSRKNGIAACLGTATGVWIFAILASFGVTALLEAAPGLYWLLKVLGGIFLFYFVIRIWGGAEEPLHKDSIEKKEQRTYTKSYIAGLITQLSNPKTILVIAGIFVAFLPSSPPPFAAFMVSILAFIIDFSWYALVVFAMSLPSVQKGYYKAKPHCDRLMAICLGFVAMRLILSDFLA